MAEDGLAVAGGEGEFGEFGAVAGGVGAGAVGIEDGVAEAAAGVVFEEGGDAVGIDGFVRLTGAVVVPGSEGAGGGEGFEGAAGGVVPCADPFGGVGAVGVEGDDLRPCAGGVGSVFVALGVNGGAGEAEEGAVGGVFFDADGAVRVGDGVKAVNGAGVGLAGIGRRARALRRSAG